MANRIKYINELDCLIRDVELVGAQLQETLDEVINNLVEKNEILAKIIKMMYGLIKLNMISMKNVCV